MLIAYLVPGTGLSEQEKLRRETLLNAIASEGVKVRVCGVTQGPAAIESAMDEYAALPHVLSFIKEHHQAYDAIILGCAGDAGLEGARETVSTPIVGPGESSILLGTLNDKRFAMITTSSARAATKFKLVRNAGLDPHRLVASLTVNIPVLEMYKNKTATMAAVVASCERAKEAGAEVMILGCMSLAFMDADLLRQAEKESGLPFVNPIVTAVRMAEALVAMSRY